MGNEFSQKTLDHFWKQGQKKGVDGKYVKFTGWDRHELSTDQMGGLLAAVSIVFAALAVLQGNCENAHLFSVPLTIQCVLMILVFLAFAIGQSCANMPVAIYFLLKIFVFCLLLLQCCLIGYVAVSIHFCHVSGGDDSDIVVQVQVQ
eukprot:TRINITY_DN9204_c0_g1_i2.p2 TRINITY_DN9204_c0_g1~~TRINITY_DN9204_c0_g1_i2.p2  ORF type:complete len:147 (+),score=19.30 TRINITY_DN9204_c0_g1_i2:385-825(+)